MRLALRKPLEVPKARSRHNLLAVRTERMNLGVVEGVSLTGLDTRHIRLGDAAADGLRPDWVWQSVPVRRHGSISGSSRIGCLLPEADAAVDGSRSPSSEEETYGSDHSVSEAIFTRE